MLSSLCCIYLKFDLFANVSVIDNDYNFALVGDWGCTSDTKKTVNSIQNTNPEFIINLGDLSYKKSWLLVRNRGSNRWKYEDYNR